MENINHKIRKQYLKRNLYEDIISRLEDEGIDLNEVERADIAGVDEFHVRGSAVSKELAQMDDISGSKVLDVGCGLGGPCRMLAAEYECTVTGIDISKEFIRTAEALSKLLKLDEQTEFIQGDATSLPFDDGVFDVVWTQHMQMNLSDKKRFYQEISRVLKSGGRFFYYDIFRKNDGELKFPVPWADSPDLSFLCSTSEMDKILKDVGFMKKTSIDQTRAGIDFFEKALAKIKVSGPPKIGLNILMEASTKPKLLNVLSNLQDNLIMLESGVYQKVA